MFFWVNAKDTSLGEFVLNITGEHNALNALAAIVTCLELGLSLQNIRQGLNQFLGTRRRFEYIKDLQSGASLYDDYAHHPTEIKKTLLAFKQTFPDKKILCIFQPHTYSRTKKFLEQFKYSFSKADEVAIVDIFPSEREAKDDTISSAILKNEISKVTNKVSYLPNLTDVVKYVDQKSYGKDWIILTMGAGNIYKVAADLI
jgi:UDP-N-acetylmuramate--alanine ligase